MDVAASPSGRLNYHRNVKLILLEKRGLCGQWHAVRRHTPRNAAQRQ